MQITTPEPKNNGLESMRKRIKLTMPSLSSKYQQPKNQISESSDSKQTQVSLSPACSDSEICGFQFFNILRSENCIRNAFEEHYQILEKLGQGANGIIRKCKHKITGAIEAVKIGSMEEENLVILKKITKILRKVDNKHILKMKQLYVDLKRHKYYQIMEYLPSKSLGKLLEEKYPFSIQDVGVIMRQLFQALNHFVQHKIAHRDIKPDNLLYDTEKKHLYVIDLGIITSTVERGRRRNLWSNTGTLYYKAPETLEFSSYNQGVDIWAAGVVLYQLIQGKTPFKQTYQIDTIQNILQIKYSFDTQKWKQIPLAKALVQRVLKPKKQRLTALQALRDPWFQVMNFPSQQDKPISPFKKSRPFISCNSGPSRNEPFYHEQNLSNTNSAKFQQQEAPASHFKLFRALSYGSNYMNYCSSQSSTNTSRSAQQLFGNSDDPEIINNNN